MEERAVGGEADEVDKPPDRFALRMGADFVLHRAAEFARRAGRVVIELEGSPQPVAPSGIDLGEDAALGEVMISESFDLVSNPYGLVATLVS